MIKLFKGICYLLLGLITLLALCIYLSIGLTLDAIKNLISLGSYLIGGDDSDNSNQHTNIRE